MKGTTTKKKSTPRLSPGDRKVLAQANATTVTYDDLARVISASAARDRAKAEPGDGVFTIIRLFAGEAPEKSMAVWFRLEALGRLVNRGRLPGWTKPKPADACVFVHSALVAAAADEPLIVKGRRFEFARGPFLSRAFQLAKQDEHRT